VGGACARQFCSATAIARVDFDGEARVVWIDELGDGMPAAASYLCRRHADTLTPPRNWELRDLRTRVGSGPTGAAVTIPEEPVTIPAEPAPLVVEPAPLVVEPALAPVADAAPAWSPRLFASVDVGAVLDAKSPLLSRAFHGAH
jgi:hypothetical protein